MIPRVSKRQFAADGYVARHSPVIIVDGLSDWSEQGRWSPEALASKIPDRIVKVCSPKGNTFKWKPTTNPDDTPDFTSIEVTFSEAAKLIANAPQGNPVYVMQQSIPHRFPELMNKIRIPEWISGRDFYDANLWYGRDSITQLHYDGQNNFFAQLHGSKEFTVFSPADTRYLYPYPIESITQHFSFVELESPDPCGQPNYKFAKPIQFNVEAGELLFLPAFWWHRVRSFDVAISINFWWLAALQTHVICPNGLRSLYRSYASDRLQKVRRQVLAPKGLDLATGAQWLLNSGANWGAAVLAIGAFDEAIGLLARSAGLLREEGCELTELPKELYDTRARLHNAHDSLPSFDAAIELAKRIGRSDQVDIDASAVNLVISLVAEVVTRSNSKATSLSHARLSGELSSL